jgi:hypothetical protein
VVVTGQQNLLFLREKMIEMATMTENQPQTASPYSYWMSFCTEWDRLSEAAYEAGQDDMGLFFAELADDAGDVWAGKFGQLGK